MDVEKIEEKLNKASAGAIAISDNIGGIMFTSMAEVMDFSALMAISKQAVPMHCRGERGVCLAICIQALEWRMSPFAVANQSYMVNDRVAYQAMLIHAVIEARAPLTGRLRPEYNGADATRSCTIKGMLKGEAEPLVYTSPEVGKIKVKNSPLWTSDVDQQLFYYASRAWARRYCPDVILGIYSEDELRDSEIGPENARDITPRPTVASRLPGADASKTGGFDHSNIERALAPPTEKPMEPITVREGEPLPVGEAPTADAPKAIRKRKAAEAPTTGATPPAEPPKARSEPLARGLDILSRTAVDDVPDLNSTILEELTNPTEIEEWNAACLAKAPA